MTSRLLWCAAIVFAVATVPGAHTEPDSRSLRTSTASPPDAAFLKQVLRHLPQRAGQERRAGARRARPARCVDGHADVWEKVVRKLRTGMMPPDGAPRPAAAARETFTASLEVRARSRGGTPARSRRAGAASPESRRSTPTPIRDLLALDVDVSALLPPDDSAAGFDNIADVLGVSPALIEGYVAAAAKISRLALGDPSIGLDRAVYRVPGDLSQDAHLDGLPLGTRGGIIVAPHVPARRRVRPAGGAGGRGTPWRASRRQARAPKICTSRSTARASRCRGAAQRALRVPAGPHTLAAAPVVRTRTAGADGIFHVDARTPGITQVVDQLAPSTRPAPATRRAGGGC